jgi:hypothetical protein
MTLDCDKQQPSGMKRKTSEKLPRPLPSRHHYTHSWEKMLASAPSAAAHSIQAAGAIVSKLFPALRPVVAFMRER